MPSLTNSWSSAMRICAGVFRVPDSLSPFVVCLPFSGSRERELRHYGCPKPWFATDLEAAVEQCDPVAHAREPHRLAQTTTAPYSTWTETRPQSLTSSRTTPSWRPIATHTRSVFACLRTLLSASWATRNKLTSNVEERHSSPNVSS